MGYPPYYGKQRRARARGTRLGKDFLKRFDAGLLIDRNQTKRTKNTVTVKLPSALAKFRKGTP